MNARLLISFTVIALLSIAAAAQDDREGKLKKGDYAPDIEADSWINVEPGEEPSLAELRGMVVVLFHWVSTNEFGEQVLPFLNLIENSAAFGRSQGVMVIGLSDADRKAIEPDVKGRLVQFPVGVGSSFEKDYELEGIAFVIVDAVGKIAFIGQPNSADDLGKALNDAWVESPPTRTHPFEAKVAVHKMEEAREYLVGEDYRRAFASAIDAVGRSAMGDPLRAEAWEFIDLLERMAYRDLDRIDALLEKKEFKEASRVLRYVRKHFRELDAGKDAKKIIERLQKDNDDFKLAVGEFGDERAAGKVLFEAVDDLRANRVGESWEKLDKLLTDYSSTEAADYARAIIDRMKTNRTAWQLVMDHKAKSDCEPLMATARNYVQAGRKQEAEEILMRVMQSYPNTIWSDQAKQMLIELR